MKLFIDTANVDEIRAIHAWGVLDGVTTNPSLVAKEGRDFAEVIREIASIVDGPISAEVVSTKGPDMVAEAKGLAQIHENVIIKVPMTADGLYATKELKSLGIKTNVTLVFTPSQALLAARAGASYVSPFVGRLDDISSYGIDLIKEIVAIFVTHHIQTEIIAASLRHPMHVVEVAKAGAHVGTIPYQVFLQMLKHPLTDAGIERFLRDWESVKRGER